MAHSHSHDEASHSHSHDNGNAAKDHGHTHEIMEHPGKFTMRDMPTYDKRDWKERAFTVGIGGPVGSGKSALLLALCRHFRDRVNLGVVTNGWPVLLSSYARCTLTPPVHRHFHPGRSRIPDSKRSFGR